ncbi:Fumarylacetoacetate hydrolase domain-containing protein 2 [Lachnellula arida]|uniref:Fumarylacetoacetate hydrolase domain-containing protein 2 n=1 Tax=Lachnellula arida TaxID=1316785 RepID=A0A8T9BN96_9HELO|nr:Fumarylacetoacetate hydrolase domain-containing protein 2 [Lachnellula arida]
MSAPKFQRLVRFENPNGKIYYGELGLEHAATEQDLIGSSVAIYKGLSPWAEDFKLTSQKEKIAAVLCPLANVPLFECIGLNYRKHVEEAGFPKEKYPTVFTKPPDALAGPYEDILVHEECQLMDYEAELCFIIERDCKNITTDEEALSCVFGYTAGNDVSSRFWQMPERSGNQHGTGKWYDKFAPIGPTIVNATAVHKSPNGLSIKTFVNGELRQDARTDDLIFDVPTIIRHLTRGKTLRQGTIIMTGTPGGVAAFMKPPQWLKDNDIVEVEIEKIGRTRNRIVLQ